MIFASASCFYFFLINLIENYKIKWFLKIQKKIFRYHRGLNPIPRLPSPLSIPLDHTRPIQPRTMLYIFKSNSGLYTGVWGRGLGVCGGRGLGVCRGQGLGVCRGQGVGCVSGTGGWVCVGDRGLGVCRGQGVGCVPGRGLYGRVLICTIFDKYPLDEVQNNVIFYLIFGVFWQFYVIFIVYLLFFLDFAVVLFGDLSKILNKHGFNSRFPSLANQISVFVVLYGDLAKILNKHGFNSRFPSLANQISVFVANE